MAATIPTTTNSYTQPKPSAMATRHLLTEIKPSSTPARALVPTGTPTPVNAPGTATRDLDACKPGSVAKLTDNYLQAAAAVAKSSAVPPSQTAKGLGAVSGTDRPGLQKQASWKMSDMKRQQHEQLLGGPTPNAEGYASTGQK